jgi:hypothetical protein
MVVELVVLRRDAVDAVIGVQVVAREIIIIAVDRAAVFEAGIDRVVAAAVHRDRAAGLKQAALALDIDDAGGAQPVLRGQAAGDQLHRIDKPGAQIVTEKADPVRDDDAVDAVLHVEVLVAHMQPAIGRIVLIDPRHLQDGVVDRYV